MKKIVLAILALGWVPTLAIEIRLGPGHILLAEDTTGQGHISRAVGSKNRISLFLTLANGATPPR